MGDFYAVSLQFSDDAFNLCFREFFKVDFFLDAVGVGGDSQGKTVFVLSDGDSGWWLSDCFVVAGDVISMINLLVPQPFRSWWCLTENEPEFPNSL